MNGEAASMELHPKATGESRAASFYRLLRSELNWYPGRPILVLRMVLACTFVMFCIIVFRIPGGVLGAYSPLLISRDSFRSTKRSAAWIAGACTLGTIEVVLGAMLSTGSPFLHLMWVWVSLFAVFYLVSIMRVYEAALSLGLFITNTIGIWDQAVTADLRLRQTLFMLLAILLGCLVTVLIEFVFSRAHRSGAVIEGIEERIAIVEKTLQNYISGWADSGNLARDLRRYSTRGIETLRAYINHAEYSFETEQRLLTAVILMGRLVDLCLPLVDNKYASSPADENLCHVLIQKLRTLKESLANDQAAEWIDLQEEHLVHNPLLVEIERTVELLSESFSQTMWDRGENRPIASPRRQNFHFFVSDAFSGRKHFKFAVRGTLSAIACYMLYMSVGWTGLNASIATCILTALPVTGAARHKQLMRFGGIVIGACVIGFAAQVTILPQIDSILSYTFLFAAMISIGAWVATSGPRIAYAGVQIVFAYELVNLGRFSLTSSLIPARDTVLGIMLGIGAMWLIFDHFWDKSATESIRDTLTATIRQIADLSKSQLADPSIQDKILESNTRDVIRNFDKIWSMLDASLFEPYPKAPSEEIVLQQARRYLPRLRALLLIKTGLIHHAIASEENAPDALAIHAMALSRQTLYQLAQKIEGGEAFSPLNPTLRLDRPASETQGNDVTTKRLTTSLYAILREIQIA
ncbi:FUSC family protein [Edaphobacter albus]|uniref:FUSC family protein n=1 Tax=Edaphobacter sp. 4G125 TaxID=2763071 RepID=UPI0016495715|nr:FUSC family protein [Edaphobacter sp. 4G125]QNI38009.1 FUSC family protein [Edaphobacter sp. 4G125]